MPTTQQNNFFGRPYTEGNNEKMGGTTASGFGDFKKNKVEGDLFNDPDNNLYGELEALTKEELKERLIVAEKVMKTLF